MRNSTVSTWTPLRLDFFDRSDISTTDVIRGYTRPVIGRTTDSVTRQVFICGDILNAGSVQFRWMGSAHLDGDDQSIEDAWALSDLEAKMVTENGTSVLFEDSFGSDILK